MDDRIRRTDHEDESTGNVTLSVDPGELIFGEDCEDTAAELVAAAIADALGIKILVEGDPVIFVELDKPSEQLISEVIRVLESLLLAPGQTIPLVRYTKYASVEWCIPAARLPAGSTAAAVEAVETDLRAAFPWVKVKVWGRKDDVLITAPRVAGNALTRFLAERLTPK